MRVKAEVNEKIVIQTLNQTRKIQVENYRRISKVHNPNHSITVRMTAYLRNPKTTRKFNRKNLHEPRNVKEIFSKHSTSNQCYVEYQNLEGEFIQVWVHNEEMVFSDSNVKAKLSDYILNTTTPPISPEFNRIE